MKKNPSQIRVLSSQVSKKNISSKENPFTEKKITDPFSSVERGCRNVERDGLEFYRKRKRKMWRVTDSELKWLRFESGVSFVR